MKKTVRLEEREYPTLRGLYDVEVTEYRVFGVKVWHTERILL